MRYFKAIKILGIMYDRKKSDDLIIKSYSKSDQIDDNVTRKSTLEFDFMLNGRLMSQYSKKQMTLTLLSTKVKYMILALAAKKAIQIRLLLIKVDLLDDKSQYIEIKIT